MLKRNFAVVLVGNAVFSGAQWFTTIAIARLGTQQMVGEFALGLAVASPTFAATGLQLRALLATDSTGRFSFAQFLRLRTIGSAIALVVIGILSIYSWPIGTALVVFVVAVRASVDSFSDIYYAKAQRHNRLDIVGWMLCVRGFTGVLAIAVVLWFTPRLQLAVLAGAVAWAVILLALERPVIARTFSGSEDAESPAQTRELLGAGIPLAGVLFLLSGSQSVPRLILQHTAGPAALGIFAAAATLSGAMGLLFGSVAQTILPMLADQFATRRSEYRRTLAFALGACAVGAACCIVLAILFAPLMMAAIFGDGYKSGAGVLAFLLLGAALSNIATILGAGATAAGRYRPQLAASGLTFVVALVVAGIAVPRWGLRGAAASVVMAGIVQVAAYAMICHTAANSVSHAQRRLEQAKVALSATAKY